MDEKILDRIAKRYFDSKFEDAVIRHGKTSDPSGYDRWFGFFVDEELILGYNVDDTENSWFYNGQYFLNGHDFFDVSVREFSKAMERYLNKKYPKMGIFGIT